MIHLVEECLQINVCYPFSTSLYVSLRGSYCIVCTTCRSKSVTLLTEFWIKHRTETLLDRLLKQPIQHGRDTKDSDSTIRFWNFYRPHRCGAI